MAEYNVFTNDEEIPSDGIVLKRARAKSKGGTLTTDVQPGQAVLPNAISALRQRAAGAYEQGQKLLDAEPDMSQLQAYAKGQGEAGQAAMLNALASQYAGDSFRPLQAQFLKKATAAQDPMKMSGGLLTPDGQFLKDPGSAQEKKAEFLLRQAQAYEQMASQAQSAQEKRLYQAQQDAIVNEIRVMNANTARMNAGTTGANANRAPSGFQWSSGPDGAPALTFIPGGPADPANKSQGPASEDERKALSWMFQADKARRNMEDVLGRNPGAAKMGGGEFIINKIPGYGGDLANAMRSDDRQKFVHATDSFAEAMLRASTGAGVNRHEAEQKIRELMPQWGDSAALVKQKREGIDNYMEALKARVGRARPMGQGVGGGAPAMPAAGNDPLGMR